MKFQAKKAVRTKRPLKVSVEGLSGSGKTFTALRLAFDMKRHGIGSKIVVMDSENGSASLYAGVEIDGERWDFDTVELTQEACNPTGYAEAYRWAVAPAQGYDIVIFDSLTHAWHGAMEQVDQLAGPKGDKFRAWATVTPQQREMLQTLTDARAHTICTMRVKSEYERTQGSDGRASIKKVGTKTDQREGAEYEFDLVLRMDAGNQVAVEKVRGCTALNGKTASKPGPAFWAQLFEWWQGGAEVPPPPSTAPGKDQPADPLTLAVRATLESAKKRWIDVINWVNAEKQTKHPTGAKFGDIDPAHLQAWVDAFTPQ